MNFDFIKQNIDHLRPSVQNQADFYSVDTLDIKFKYVRKGTLFGKYWVYQIFFPEIRDWVENQPSEKWEHFNYSYGNYPPYYYTMDEELEAWFILRWS